MSRVNVDAVAFTDPRFVRLAQILGLADSDHARSKVEWLWLDCTSRGETSLPQWLVEQRLGPRGPEALIESELARWSRGRGDSKTRTLYIRGASERTAWLSKHREQSSKGGKARASTSSRAAGRFTSQLASQDASPLTPPPTPPPDKKKAASPSAQPDLSLIPEAPERRAEPPAHQPAIAAFDRYYRDTHENAKPTWDAARVSMLKTLCSKHTCAEVVRRIGIVRASPPKFPPQPWDLKTFVAQFDNCAADSSGASSDPRDRIRSIPQL